MTAVTLVLDIRERALAAELADEPFSSAALDCGDIQVCLDGLPVIVLERKTLPDLAQSIKDGRYREQKLRLLCDKHKERRRVGYVLEGGSWSWDDLPDTVSGMPRRTLQTAAINGMFRDDLHVVFTKSVSDTASFVRRVLQRVRKNPSAFSAVPNAPDGSGEGTQSSYSQFLTVSTKKSDNVTPRTVFVMQMRQVPGIAEKAASAICDKWTTMTDLCGSATPEALAEVRVGGRRLGTKTAVRICETLGITPGTPPVAELACEGAPSPPGPDPSPSPEIDPL